MASLEVIEGKLPIVAVESVRAARRPLPHEERPRAEEEREHDGPEDGRPATPAS